MLLHRKQNKNEGVIIMSVLNIILGILLVIGGFS